MKFDDKTLKRYMKTYFAAYYYIQHSEDLNEIAAVIKVPVKKLQEWMRLPRWQEAIDFWGGIQNPPGHKANGDLAISEKMWNAIFDTRPHGVRQSTCELCRYQLNCEANIED